MTEEARVMVTVNADDLVLAFRAAGNAHATEEQWEAAERLFLAARKARMAARAEVDEAPQ